MISFKAKTESGEIIRSVFSPFNFPAGEAHTKINEQRSGGPEGIEIAVLQPTPESIHNDLFQLAVWNNTVFTVSPESSRVAVIPYFPAARADRGIHFDLEVYTDFIRDLGLTQIILFDPHSHVVVNELTKSEKVTVVQSWEVFEQAHINPLLGNYTGIIAPDKGALERAADVAHTAGLKVYTATKERNPETGKLSNFEIEGLPLDGKYLIIDDICDGGGTFMGLAEASRLRKDQLDLYVSHGVFSGAALVNLPKFFGHVFTTNSYNPSRKLNVPDNPSAFIRFDIVHLLLSKIES